MKLLARSTLVLALVAALCSTTSVQAQMTRRQRSQRITPEQAQAVWTLQASHVAAKLGLSEEQTTKLVDAYRNARESRDEAVRKAWEVARPKVAPLGQRAIAKARTETRQKITKTVTEKFAKDVGTILDKEETKLAVTYLGAFGGEFDRRVNVIIALKLDEAKQAKALDIVNTYVVKSAAASGDRVAMSAVPREQHAKISEAMATVLSEKELAKWNAAFERGRLRGTRRSTRSVQPQETRRRRRQPITPEQTQAVWTLQASHVAAKLGLSEEQATKLVDAYRKARESRDEAVRKAWEVARPKADPKDRSAMFRSRSEARRKASQAVTEKFAKDVGTIMDAEKAKTAVKHLGTFSTERDRMVNLIAGLELGKAKQAKALDIVNAYVVESAAAREKVAAGGDRTAMSAVPREQRAKLSKAMGTVLSEKELATWNEAFARGRLDAGPRPGSSGGRRRRSFTKQVEVLGIRVLATADSSDEIVLHVANILAEYLDNDEDGVADNQEVMDALIEGKATYRHANDAEVHPNGAAKGVFDASLEEVLHMITDQGYGIAYPEVFGRVPGTEIANALDKARGGQFMEVPEQYPPDAWFTYDDETCDYDCMNSEYIYWVLTSILGAQDYPGRLEQIEREWRLNTREKIKEGDPAAYALFTNPKYKFPTVLPDGKYKAKKLTIEKYP